MGSQTQVVTLEKLRQKDTEKQEKLKRKLFNDTHKYLDSINGDLEESKEIANQILEDEEDECHKELNNILGNRNKFLEYVRGLNLEEDALVIINHLICNSALQSSNRVVTREGLESLHKCLKISEQEKEHLMKELEKLTNESREIIEGRLNLQIDVSEYINKPNEFKEILKESYLKRKWLKDRIKKN